MIPKADGRIWPENFFLANFDTIVSEKYARTLKNATVVKILNFEKKILVIIKKHVF